MKIINADKLIEKLSINLDNPEEFPVINIGTLIRMIDNEQEVQPEQKVGRWISHPEWERDGECSVTCSECEMGVDVLYNFCPRCGVKMENKER